MALYIFPVIAIPILQRREAGYFFEDDPEGFGVGIAYFVHGLIDTEAGSFEVLFDHFHFYALNILHHGVAGGVLKSAFEVPAAEREHGSDLADRYPGVDILFDKFLCGADGGIFVVFLAAEDNEGRLTAAVDVYLEPFGAKHRYFAARVFFDEVKDKVEPGIGSAACVDIIFVRDDLVCCEAGCGEHLSEFPCQLPMGSANPVIEQTGAGQQEGADAKRGDSSAAMILPNDPGQHVLIIGQDLAFIAVDGGDEDEIGMGEIMDQDVGAYGKQSVFHPDFVVKADKVNGEGRWSSEVGQVVIYPGEDLVGAFDVGDAAFTFRHQDGDMFHCRKLPLKCRFLQLSEVGSSAIFTG